MVKVWLRLLLCAWIPSLWAGQIQQLEVTQELGGLRLTLSLSAGTSHKYSILQNPDRLVLDLLNTQRGNFDLDKSRLLPPIVGGRVAQRDADLRFVFNFDAPPQPNIYRIKSGEGERLVVELRSPEPPNKKSATQPAAAEPVAKTAPSEPPASSEPPAAKTLAKPAAKPPTSTASEPEPAKKTEPPGNKASKAASPAPAAKPAAPDNSSAPEPSPESKATNEPETNSGHSVIRGRKIVVAIDAGHGGKDTGAIGAKGVREKDVVLGIARELADQFNRDGRYKAVLTRSGDSFIPLKGRRDKARRMKADLFISVHADAFSTAEATGASVFALSQRGATSEMARFLADSENSSDLAGSVGGVNLEDKDEVLAGVLVDLSMTATLANSLDVGGRVLRELGKVTRLHNRQVEQAGFVVLKSPDVPSILVETGFISNPGEAQELASPSHRQALAKAIFSGVRSYFATSGALAEPLRATEPPPPARPQVQPDTPKVTPPTSPGKPRPVSPPKSDPTPSPAPGPVRTILHTVLPGDTLAKIAQQYRVPAKAIQELNKLPNGTVKTGQRLKIPLN